MYCRRSECEAFEDGGELNFNYKNDGSFQEGMSRFFPANYSMVGHLSGNVGCEGSYSMI